MSEQPWGEMTARERDMRTAQALGYTIYHYDKDYRENCYYMLMDPGFNPVLPGREGERKTEVGAWADCPRFTTDHNDSRLLEDAIERRGDAVQDDYMRALLSIVAPDGSSVGCFWKVIRATPDQRAQAFVETMKGAQHATMGAE